MGKLIKAILMLGAVLTLFFGIYSWNEKHDARSEALLQLAQKFDGEFTHLSQRFEYKSESDVLREMRSEILQYEKEFKTIDKAPTATRQRWEKLILDYNLQQEKVKCIQAEMIKKKK